MKSKIYIYTKIISLLLLSSITINNTNILAATTDSGKSIYVPSSLGNVNDDNNQWSYSRSKQSDNFIIFWEAGYGTNPNLASNGSYQIDVDNLLNIAEKSFDFYADSLKFIKRGSSKTDLYKMIIKLRYTQDWEATGSGVEDMIGLLTLTAWSAKAAGHTLAHEVGHCFQYQVHCDNNNNKNGWMYGFGLNGSGGNCWWEQCAQWQAFKIYPELQFTDGRFVNYMNTAHKHILHETPRYDNYFIQDYWTFLHGMDFIGRLWNESVYPEDPVNAYKRITDISQSEFCDEMYDCAARFASWDIPALRSYGESKIDTRPQPAMNLSDDNYWVIDSTNCVENYGYNILKLNIPEEPTTIEAYFEGLVNTNGFRKKNYNFGEWRYGFVALLKNGERIYSPMQKAVAKDSKDTVSFTTPENCEKLWFVVSGGTRTHWLHAWDDDDSNDEQWPYKVKFENTNLYGVYNFGPDDKPYNDTLTYDLVLAPYNGSSSTYPSTPMQPDLGKVCRAFCLQMSEIREAYKSGKITYAAINPNGTLNSTSTANAPGHWFSKSGYVTNWGNSSYIFSELQTNSLTFNIGQYPGLCKEGDKITIRQALTYKTDVNEAARITFVFNITISSFTGIENEFVNNSTKIYSSNNMLCIDQLPADGYIYVHNIVGLSFVNEPIKSSTFNTTLPQGIYIVTVKNKNDITQKKIIIN
ncbi:DUF4859 domain-containing protein [Dysgonomonas sp. 216]|uniref:DUF6055 domain-containing protein n=1 Tax=Dysgonomonas sp. 216 TaxID=2302934 RepID=UPI0013D35C54|nr:DUF6055 domain-containing protein [Dysgonomonas sp. 216]NDW19145.1 DUF4859 domain-containing protein [Dysgonomonas sp. 216]